MGIPRNAPLFLYTVAVRRPEVERRRTRRGLRPEVRLRRVLAYPGAKRALQRDPTVLSIWGPFPADTAPITLKDIPEDTRIQ